MKQVFKLWQKSDKFFSAPLFISGLSIFLLITTLIAFYHKLPPRLPLFYSLPWGEKELASKEQFFLLPIILLLVTLVNFFVASQLHPVQFILKRTLMLSLILLDLIILITAVKVLLIFL